MLVVLHDQMLTVYFRPFVLAVWRLILSSCRIGDGGSNVLPSQQAAGRLPFDRGFCRRGNTRRQYRVLLMHPTSIELMIVCLAGLWLLPRYSRPDDTRNKLLAGCHTSLLVLSFRRAVRGADQRSCTMYTGGIRSVVACGFGLSCA